MRWFRKPRPEDCREYVVSVNGTIIFNYLQQSVVDDTTDDLDPITTETLGVSDEA
jgi:hypothetical protein